MLKENEKLARKIIKEMKELDYDYDKHEFINRYMGTMPEPFCYNRVANGYVVAFNEIVEGYVITTQFVFY